MHKHGFVLKSPHHFFENLKKGMAKKETKHHLNYQITKVEYVMCSNSRPQTFIDFY